MGPEDHARQSIDDLLQQCGWIVQDRARLNLGAGRGIAIREFSLRTGAADYLLFVDRQAVGTVEAKKVGDTLTGVEEQSTKYRVGLPAGLVAPRDPLPFAYETTGIETRFTSQLDPDPRSRGVFAFHRPEALAEWLAQAPDGIPTVENETLRARLLRMPPLAPIGLRDCQYEAITQLERSFAENRPRALIQMATGAGKTYTAVSAIYRLVKHAGARRVLFLVDRANLGRQTLKEFQQFVTPDDGRKFTELYNVQHLQTNRIDPVARVCITTIQRLYSMLCGEPDLADPTLEEASLFELGAALAGQPPKEVRYNPAIPIETFDVIITDECHRSIYNLWRGVLDYFDAFIVGLTATPNKQTFGFFNRNLVMEYGHDRAVADGVNVDYQVYRIRTDITERGGRVESGEWVDRRDRQTRAIRWEQLDDDLAFSDRDLDRSIVVPDQIRTVIRAFRDALPDLFLGRGEVPKTLIFAKDDSHADDIVQIVREEFGKGNEFAQKITYKTTGRKPEELIAEFRNSYYPRIAVTVDMIATGTDIKPLEVLFFMRSVKSQGFFEQMKGRGTRTITDGDLRAVTPDAAHGKTHFVLVDAVGVCERTKTDEPPLERKRSVAFDKLLDAVALGAHDEDTLSSLAGRLGRLATRLTPAEAEAVARASGGQSARDLAVALIGALDPDRRVEAARAASGQADPDNSAMSAAARQLAAAATAPFDNPDLREVLKAAQLRDEQTIATPVMDTLTFAGWDAQAEDRAHATVASFRQFMDDHRDAIAALQAFYSRPRHLRLRENDVRALQDAILTARPGLTTDAVWQAYDHIEHDRVRGANLTHALTDLVSLVRFTLERERDPAIVLEPYRETVARRFAAWLAEQQAHRAVPFTSEQLTWLEMIRDAVAASMTVEPDDFEGVPFVARGGLGRAYQLFGDELPALLAELNERLAAA
jgi:type I restriction enzyme R subunit